MNANEPLWRKVLTWGAVMVFLALPILVLTIHLTSFSVPNFEMKEHMTEFKYLGVYYTTITTLVFALAGLNSWDKRNGK
jgi:hypothetical protein